ncbi:TonB-dependent receptor [Chitinophaga lutea]
MNTTRYPIPACRWRLLCAILAVCFLGATLHARAGDVPSLQQTMISVNYQGIPLKRALLDIEKKSGLKFIYASENVEPYTSITLRADRVSVAEALTRLLQHTRLTFREQGKKVLIMQKPAALPPPVKKAPVTAVAAPEPDLPVKGVITNSKNEALIGVNVKVKGTNKGATSDVNGHFTVGLPGGKGVLVFSYIGYMPKEVSVTSDAFLNVRMDEDQEALKTVVVVGYATQKKESVVGAVTAISSESLDRRGGVTNLASALSGQIPGVTVMETTGEPGRGDPSILIRGQSTWNGAQPLILVDGIERKMNDINVSEVATISVLKDASATAVFGVKGANGVILITTKRGQTGKSQLKVSVNNAFKTISRIPDKLDAFDAQLWKNVAVEREVSVNEAAWKYILPYQEVLRSRKPQQAPYNYLYPNVDWQDAVTNDYATNQRVNMNISGGTEFARYFASLGYLREGDIIAAHYNPERRYNPGYAYNRFNFRSNLDFTITKTTTLSTNISGYMGVQKRTAANFTNADEFTSGHIYRALYELAPDAFPIQYPDGMYGKDPKDLNMQNPIALIQNGGVLKTNRKHIGVDLKLDQKLDFLVKGLSFTGNIAYDNYSITNGPNILDGGNQGQTLYEYISPAILTAKNRQDSLNAIQYFPSSGVVAINEFDFVYRPWTIGAEYVVPGRLERSLFYQAGLNYAQKFDRHDVSALVLFNRRKNATGAVFASYREDWVGRVTYNYNGKYFAEVNGAYNGSEKFSPQYRFGFFPSAAAGWMVSNEAFMQRFKWLDKFKVRGSIGKVGSDNGIPRWGYVDSWVTGTGSLMANNAGLREQASPYPSYRESVIANPDITWETATKQNIGAELSFLNMISLTMDFFRDKRENIFMSGNLRNIPVLFGASPVPANIGMTRNKGFEIELGFRSSKQRDWGYWATFSMTRARDVVLESEDPALQPAYLKNAGFQIGQTRTQISSKYINNWDDIYASAPLASNMNWRLPGDWDIVDYNGDGVIDNFDVVAYGYPTRPSNTYSATLGGNFRSISIMVQFFAVTNISLRAPFIKPAAQRWSAVSSELNDYWTPQNPGASYKSPRLTTTSPEAQYGIYDGSYLRLKTAEIAWTMPASVARRLGIGNARIYINGNNLAFWSDLPMDRETGTFDIQNAYPIFKQLDLGIDISF